MRGRVAILLLFLVGSLPVFPQCNWTPRQSASFRTSALDLSVDGSLVWLATGYGIQLLDGQGTHVADAAALPGNTRVIRADGRGFAYAGSGSRLYVLRREGTTIQALRFADAGAPINDILIVDQSLFVATTAGLTHFQIFDPANPVRNEGTLPTSSANVTSLAVSGTKLYAADGDATLEVFSLTIPSLPQHTGELASVVRATAVHAAPDGTLLVSDAFGQNTDVFAGTTATGRLPVGANAFASAANGVHFVAGPDRTLRAVDFTSTTTLKELFEHQLSPTGGTDNVIHAMARAGTTLYVAAGDIGLAIFDIRALAPPYPLASYRTTATTSTVLSGDRAWFADGTGTISEQKIVSTGIALTNVRTWNGGTIVHDVEGTELLTSNAETVTSWQLGPTTPVPSTFTFRGAVRSAAVRTGGPVALLEDGTVWIGGAAPQQVALPLIAQLVRAGSGYLFVETRDEGKTVLHYYPAGDFGAEPRRFTLDGVATGRVALDATRAAVFTFRGVEIVDLASGAVRVIAGSNRTIPRQLAFSGDDLLFLDKRTLFVYDDARTLVREQFLPADGVALDAQPSLAVLATTEGTMAVSYLGEQPEADIPFTSTFYTRFAAAADRLYLFAPGTIDIFTLDGQYVTGVPLGGTLDIAASDDGLFALSASGMVSAYSPQGALLRQVTLNEGADAQPLAIRVAGHAVWVSFTKGCLSGGCQQKTLVLDPATLAVTSSLNGGVKDVVTAGTRAYALFDFPAEVRILNIADARQPSQVLAIAAPAGATSLAASTCRLFVLGDKLYEYTESTMLLKTTYFTAMTPDKTQQVRIDGDCLVVTGRSAHPELYSATTLAPQTSFEVPATVRMMAT
ncbi:MAG: hypothetical protein ABI779_06305, partial [Acidobacteriota bacterium]